jgi:hypothetical protein
MVFKYTEMYLVWGGLDMGVDRTGLGGIDGLTTESVNLSDVLLSFPHDSLTAVQCQVGFSAIIEYVFARTLG